MTTHVPSPPKQTKEGRGSAQSRRKQPGTKKGSKVDNHTISWVLSQQPPPPHQGKKADAIQSNQRRSASSSGGRGSALRSIQREDEPPRSDSRIEIEGDNFSKYDDDDGRQDAADEETLEELTWELASQSGRISGKRMIASINGQLMKLTWELASQSGRISGKWMMIA